MAKKSKWGAPEGDEPRDFRNPLRKYLARYGQARGSRMLLEARLRRLEECAGLPGIDARIAECRELLSTEGGAPGTILVEVMRILEFLPEGSLGRRVLEARYVEGLDMYEGRRALGLSRSAWYRMEAEALDELASYPYVRNRLGIQPGQ